MKLIILVCNYCVSDALEDLSFKNPEDSFAPFKVDAQFIGSEDFVCSYCNRHASWKLIHLGAASGNPETDDEGQH